MKMSEKYCSDYGTLMYLKGWIDSLGLWKVTVDSCIKLEGDNYKVTISGGYNGSGNWNIYIHSISEIIKSFNGSWLISLSNDNLDDNWTLELGVRLTKLK